MRKVELRMNEQEKYETIKKLVETNGSKERAAVKLGCCIRTVNRLIKVYNEEGKAGFVHGNRGRTPAKAIPLDTRNMIVKDYIDNYTDTNFRHFSEIVKRKYNISVSDTTLNKWMREEDVISPKATRKTRKSLKKKLQDELENTDSKRKKEDLKEEIASLDEKDAHPRRPRCKYFGEMIQMDAASREWVPGQKWHLHCAVDDATGEVVGAYFDTQETLYGYYNVFYQILTGYGIPYMFYTDRRTIFEYRKKKDAFDDEDTFTQFSYACKTLGVDIKTTSVPQAKGRIERLLETLQSRLPVELREAGVKSIEEANEFLKSYLKEFNDQFALHINSTRSVFEKQPSVDEINRTLAVLSTRKIDSGSCIRYHNRYYIPVTENGIRQCMKKGTEAMVIESFDHKLYANIMDSLYIMEEIPEHEEYSRELDGKPKEEKPKKHYIPPMTHPWRIDNFITFQTKQKHQNGANV